MADRSSAPKQPLGNNRHEDDETHQVSRRQEPRDRRDGSKDYDRRFLKPFFGKAAFLSKALHKTASAPNEHVSLCLQLLGVLPQTFPDANPPVIYQIVTVKSLVPGQILTTPGSCAWTHPVLLKIREDRIARNIFHRMSVVLCTAGYDHTIRFWEALSGICSRTIPHPDSQVNRLAVSPDKRFLAAAGHHTVKLYDIRSTNPAAILTFEGHTGNITAVQFHCESKWLVTSSEDGTVRIWDTRSGHVQRNYSHDSPVNDVVIHPNQGELISCDRGGNVRIWDLGENRCSHQLIPSADSTSVASVTVATDGSLLCAAVSSSNEGKVFIWRLNTVRDVTTLMPVTEFVAHPTYIMRVLLSPDVRKLATCSADHTAKIWSVDPEALEAEAEAVSVGAGPSNTSPTLSSQSIDSDASPHHQKTRPLPLESELDGHQRWVWDCAFSADSAYLVTACSDHYARLWDLNGKTIIRQYNGHHRGAVCVALNDYSGTDVM